MSMNQATIQIARVSQGGDVEDRVDIQIVRGDEVIRVSMSLQECGELVTGNAFVPCDVVRWKVAKEKP